VIGVTEGVVNGVVEGVLVLLGVVVIVTTGFVAVTVGFGGAEGFVVVDSVVADGTVFCCVMLMVSGDG
jgi:hypothetical protein